MKTVIDIEQYEKTATYDSSQLQHVQAAEALQVHELDYVKPPIPNELPNEYGRNIYTWYRLHDDHDYETLKAAYVGNRWDEKEYAPTFYPTIVCVEATDDNYISADESRLHSLDSLMRNTELFYHLIGVHVDFSKEV